MLIWITGLSGAGKSTLSEALKNRIISEGLKPLIIDGDVIREILQDLVSNKHTKADRLKYATIYSRLGHTFSEQGLVVIVATISMFEEIRKWNRANNEQYCEIYLKIEHSLRSKRDKKNIYTSNKDIVEFADGFDEPQNPDFIFDSSNSLGEMVEEISNFVFEVIHE